MQGDIIADDELDADMDDGMVIQQKQPIVSEAFDTIRNAFLTEDNTRSYF